jgi:carboxyl-terminal processing protease
MSKRNLIWLAVIAAAAVAGVLLVRTPQPRGGGGGMRPGPAEQTRRLIRESYYQPLPDGTLDRAAIRGMVESLDEFSSYVPPEQVRAFQRRMGGKAFGLGLRVEIVDGQVRVIGPLADSPAHRAGIVAGDRILSIDGKKLKGLAMKQVRRLLVPADDTPVGLEMLRATGARKTVRLTAAPFCLETVTGLFRDDAGKWVHLIVPSEGIAYLRLREFTPETSQQFQRAFRQLARLEGVVLDLRNNPGGARPAAIAIADMFLRKGTIVIVEHRTRPAEHHVAHEAGTVPDVPVVVLIDSRTASAAELVAGSLQAGDRAVLVGERTRGKGCIQTMIPLGGDLGQINLTTAWFHFGSGESIMRAADADRWGIDPHVPVAVPAARRVELDKLFAREEVLSPPKPTTRPVTRATTAPDAARTDRFLKLDPQLDRAVDLLRTPQRITRILEKAAERRAAEAKAREKKDSPSE